MSPAPLSARTVTLKILTEWQKHKHTASELLNQQLTHSDRPAMTTELVYGVIRNLDLLDHLVEKLAKIKIRHTQPHFLNLLRLGTWELVFTPQTADYAIINEAADLAGKHSKQRGFVNAVLRSVQRAIHSRQELTAQSDAVCAIPLDEEFACIFNQPILPDPKHDIVNYLSTLYSIPHWLIEIWTAAFGPDATKQICIGSNRVPGVILQPNVLKTTAAKLFKALEAEAAGAKLSGDQTCLRLTSHRPLTDLWSFQQGLFIVQDPTAAKAARILAPPPGSVAVDLCAAPGGKTVQLAMLMENQGRIIASDADLHRLKKVDENARRLGIDIIKCVGPDEIKNAIGSKNKVHSVLLDVPCSNTGVMARRVEVRHRLTPQAVEQIAKVQNELLETAASLIRKHGHLLYSTCSILPDENEHRVRQFIQKHPEFRLVKEELTLPSVHTPHSIDHDGGYLALLKKE